mmetsp:Transcript_35679/g.69907  ORF Transcript_35679/g.69907 Transcript_35679/m.69907 type:complete len:235 (-) Transcript_35679:42-746(-)
MAECIRSHSLRMTLHVWVEGQHAQSHETVGITDAPSANHHILETRRQLRKLTHRNPPHERKLSRHRSHGRCVHRQSPVLNVAQHAVALQHAVLELPDQVVAEEGASVVDTEGAAHVVLVPPKQQSHLCHAAFLHRKEPLRLAHLPRAPRTRPEHGIVRRHDGPQRVVIQKTDAVVILGECVRSHQLQGGFSGKDGLLPLPALFLVRRDPRRSSVHGCTVGVRGRGLFPLHRGGW